MANLLKNKISQQLQQARYLPRWVQRHVKSIIEPNNYNPITDSVQPQNQHDPTQNNILPNKNTDNKTQVSSTIRKTKEKCTGLLKTTFDTDGNLVYTKMGNNDIRKLMLLEGKTLIKEALQSGCKLKYILFSRSKEVEYLKPFLPKADTDIFKIPYRELQSWSDLVTAPGIMAIFQIPDLSRFEPTNPLPITVVCDNIREPSNLGAILRICSGAGCEKIVLTKGCVNVWETKVLRSSSGAHFKIKVVNRPEVDDLSTILPKNCNIFIADNKTVNFATNEHSSGNLPIVPYFSVDFKLSQHIVLVIGGETEGISDKSYQLAADHGGARLNIPLENGLNSLNSGSALGIIIFEIKRQLINLKQSELDTCIVERIKEHA
ncbi:hypothetical protein GWI33_014133 [Rhynchophorus ferrugineus]|uniref:RNA 2-O ribose methyltransferase substrate binding domain-containing protein n=1 Tax=Rhynchophorus ferrugineus TaxID=354439 RepID=A0A834I547_RHYFE|nr:hypothetical protein GWI33_014133 [Rhynchophorus ferrugineus]